MNAEHELFGELHEQEEYGLFGNEHRRQLANVASQSEQLMGGLIKPLNWIDNPKKRRGDIYKVMSRADVPMPHTVGNACIEITEQTYPYEYYEATLWCFNRGTNIAEGKSVDEAKSNAFRWWADFVCGFLL